MIITRSKLPALIFGGFVAIFFIVFHAPFDFIPMWFYAFDLRRILLCVLLIFTALVFIFSNSLRVAILQQWQSFPRWTHYALAVFFTIGICSALFNAIWLSPALMGVGMYALLILCTLTVAVALRTNPEMIKWMLWILYLSIIVYVIQIFFNLAFIISDPLATLNVKKMLISDVLLRYNFANQRFFDNVISWSWALIILPCLTPSASRQLKTIAFIALMCLWYVGIEHKSRTLLLELIVVLPLAFFAFGSLGRKFVLWQFAAIVSAIGLFYLVSYLIALGLHIPIGAETVLDRNIGANADRYLLWQVAFHCALNHPLLGIGSLNIPYYLYGLSPVSSPHGIYWRIMAEWGFVALGLCGAILVYGLFKLNQLRQTCLNPTTMVFMLALMCILIDGAFSGFFLLPLGQIGAIFIISYLISCFAVREFTPSVRSQWLSILIISVIILLFTIPFIQQVIMLPEIKRSTTYSFAPTFWLVGWWQAYFPTTA